MDILKWKITEVQLYRLLAKGVAISDMILSTISMMLAIALLVVRLVGTDATAGKDENAGYPNQLLFDLGPHPHPHYTVSGGLWDAPVWVFCVVVGICAMLTTLRMWTVIRLLSATQLGREPFGALRLASTWMTVSIVFLVLDIIALVGFGLPDGIVFAIRLLLHGVMMCIVFRYMLVLNQEILERIITSIPVSVTEQESEPRQAFRHREAPLGLDSVTTTTSPCNYTEMN